MIENVFGGKNEEFERKKKKKKKILRGGLLLISNAACLETIINSFLKVTSAGIEVEPNIISRFHKEEISSVWGQCETCNTFFPTADLLKHHLLRAHTAKKDPADKMQCPVIKEGTFQLDPNFRHCKPVNI
jgi:hypothetical protein